MQKKDKTIIIVLAGGKGTRMKSELPKVLVKFKGKTLIRHIFEKVSSLSINQKPVVIVGYKKELVMQELGDKCEYIYQEEQLGTGHAVMIAEKMLKNKADNIIVLYGDHPLINTKTIKKLLSKHTESKANITMATFTVPNFEKWRVLFYKNFSRIIRDKNKKIIKDVQFKDANDEEKKVKELNPCYFCFNASWLWNNLKKLNTNNTQKEYYLTDLVKIAMQEKTGIESININPKEALGVNSKEELEILEKFAV